MTHNYIPDEDDKEIESTSTLCVWVCSKFKLVTISDMESSHCNGYIHMHKGEAIAAARAILKHFGEGLE